MAEWRRRELDRMKRWKTESTGFRDGEEGQLCQSYPLTAKETEKKTQGKSKKSICKESQGSQKIKNTTATGDVFRELPELFPGSLYPTETGFHHISQAGLELLGSSDPPASASQSAGIKDMNHCAPLTTTNCFCAIFSSGLSGPSFYFISSAPWSWSLTSAQVTSGLNFSSNPSGRASQP
ncbi:hypothetical protein AAY473_034429 [Plecturocebus cupreus]